MSTTINKDDVSKYIIKEIETDTCGHESNVARQQYIKSIKRLLLKQKDTRQGGKLRMDITTLKTTDLLANDYYKRYNNKKFMEKPRQIFISFLKGNRVLDVGCGTGRDCREFSNVGLDVDGIDISEKMLNIAKKEAPKAHLYQENIEELTFDRKYNGIWVCSSLYHISKTKVLDILKVFYSGLKKDGILFLTIKEGVGEGYRKRKYFGNLTKFYAFYKDYEIMKLLDNAGFNAVLMEKEYKDQKWINIYAKKK